MFEMILLPSNILAGLAALQGICLGVDELICHRRRSLPRWERIGHPVDAAFLAASLSVPGFMEFNQTNLYVFAILAVISCLIVTKDEFVHAHECDGFESWLHAVMFMLHPLVLVFAGLNWQSGEAEMIRSLLPAMAGAVGIYQLIYWNRVIESKNQ